MILNKTFPKGGIHPREEKELSCNVPISNAAISSTLIVPLQQHIGAPAECLVEVGDRVEEEMLIAQSAGFVSVPIHSPVPGTVQEIKDIYLPNGLKTKAVVIEMSGEFNRLGKRSETHEWREMPCEDIMARIKDMGVVGMGGATFPSHVKFSLPKGMIAEYLLLNGAECEPYLSADHRIMLERTKDILEGLEIIEKVLKPEKIVIGIEENKPDAIEAFNQAIAELGLSYKVEALQVKYPQGDEKQLIKAITGREVPSGSLPLDTGCVVANAGTLLAVYEAMVLKKPVIERVVTVSGGAVKRPGNYKVRIGTPIADLIHEAGGLTEIPEKIVSGGPMMGFAINDLETPVTKGTSGILCLTSKEVKKARRTNCLQCGRCIEACPIGLNPTQLFKNIDHSRYDESMADGLMDCRECGCCAYVCPAHIPLVQGFRVGKRMARQKKVKA